MLPYRPEIDGLRALAVVSVILFHAGFSGFSGGFVGVDCFFVISGYLITSLVLRDLSEGRFSFANFYERRARRILPALALVVLVSYPVAWVWLMPTEFRAYATTIVATVLMGANVLFWIRSDYFAPAAEREPLLHVWSLSVEEQFYILFPLIFVLLWRHRRSWLVPGMVLAAGASLWLGHALAITAPSSGFYLLPGRAWELLFGALCAFVHLPARRNRDNALSLAGLAALVAAILIYDHSTPFPSAYALLPVLGTCAVLLFARKGTLVWSLLTLRPVVAIGLISYSAYLWHQPLFAFARIRLGHEPDWPIMAGLALASLVLAYPTWRFVEIPVRQGRYPPIAGRKGLVLSLGLVLAGLVTLAMVTRQYEGFPDRLSPQARHMADSALDRNMRDCIASVGDDRAPADACIYGNPQAVDFAIFGDSHAHALAQELGNALMLKGKGLAELSYSACPPIAKFQTRAPEGLLDCDARYTAVMAYLQDMSSLRTVVIIARWPFYLGFTRFDNQEGGLEPGDDFRPYGPAFEGKSDSQMQEVVAQSYLQLVQDLQRMGKRVVIVYPVPEAGWVVPEHIAKSIWIGPPLARPLSTSQSVYQARIAATAAIFDAIEGADVLRVLPETVFCNGAIKGRCLVEDGSYPFYSDDDHLNSMGARMLAAAIVGEIHKKGWIEP